MLLYLSIASNPTAKQASTPPMSITIAQLNSLADYFGFNINEARDFLAHSQLKRGRTNTSITEKVKISDKYKEKISVASVKANKRGPTGYHLFVKDYSPVITAKLKANLRSGEKLSPGTTLSAVGAEWRALSDRKRESWNMKAASNR